MTGEIVWGDPGLPDEARNTLSSGEMLRVIGATVRQVHDLMVKERVPLMSSWDGRGVILWVHSGKTRKFERVRGK